MTLIHEIEQEILINPATKLVMPANAGIQKRSYGTGRKFRRTKEIQVNGCVFRYSKIDQSLYFGFKKEKGFFIATPEKALLDAFYLMSYGRYALDISALDTNKLVRENIRRLSSEFPLKTQHMLKKHRYLQAT